MPNVIIATTMWDEVGEEKALLRQKELEESFWKDMLDSGCTTKQFKNTPESAWDIVDSKMTDGLKLNLLLQEEMGRHGKPINETSAFQSLKEEGLPRLFLGLLKIRIGRYANLLPYMVDRRADWPIESGTGLAGVPEIKLSQWPRCMMATTVTIHCDWQFPKSRYGL